MRYLLDSNVLLFALAAPERLNSAARQLLENERGSLFLSAVTSWEITIKYVVGRLRMPDPPATCIPAWTQNWGVLLLDISHNHVLAVADLPSHHQDPFDRLLIAQAQIEQMTVLTTDRIFRKYPINVILCGA